MQAYLDRLSDKPAMDFINKVGDLFKTLPALPKGLVEFLVKIAPYLALLSAVVTIVFGPLFGLLGTLASILSVSPVYMIWVILTLVVMIAEAILWILAYKPLQARAMQGWIYMFWASALSAVDGALGILNGDLGSLIGALIGLAISFYILFQMRPFYGKVAAAVEKMS